MMLNPQVETRMKSTVQITMPAPPYPHTRKLRTWLGTIIILALFSLVIGYRIIVEENALKAEFGQEYLEYAKKTKRLFPFLF